MFWVCVKLSRPRQSASQRFPENQPHFYFSSTIAAPVKLDILALGYAVPRKKETGW